MKSISVVPNKGQSRSSFLVPFLLILGFSAVNAAEFSETNSLTLEARQECMRALEKVRWEQRIWPDQNPAPKPAFAEIVNSAMLERKAQDALRMSRALAERYDDPVTPEQLQAELGRMVRNTQAPNVLEGMFNALGKDANLIAECLVRPILAEKRLRAAYSRDDLIHGPLRARVNEALSGVQHLSDLTTVESRALTYVLAGYDSASEAEEVISLDEPEWSRLLLEVASIRDTASRREASGAGLIDLRETQSGFTAREIRDSVPGEISIEYATWRKQSFKDWWAGSRQAFLPEVEVATARHALPQISDVSSQVGAGAIGESWYVPEIPHSRFRHTAVWTGSEMIVWGGVGAEGTGGRYDPVTDSWKSVSTMNEPSSRWGHTAVWTGTEMIIWGGRDFEGQASVSGMRYDPVEDSWSAVSSTGEPPNSDHHTAIWTGEEMILWGGASAAYDPLANSWRNISTTNSPLSLREHTATWTGSEMIVWGGNDYIGDALNSGARYDPVADIWTQMSTENAPSPRYDHVAVWTGSDLIVWGGLYPTTNTGGRYDPETDSWSATATEGAPTPTLDKTAVWTGEEMIVWGGSRGTPALGGRYNPIDDSWTTMATLGEPLYRQEHTAVWTGSEMIIWGGSSDTVLTSTGGRYNPETDSWMPTRHLGAPTERRSPSSVWTGNEVILWGGAGGPFMSPNHDTGGRYELATDSWLPTSLLNNPGGSHEHVAIWTGTEMIIWAYEKGSRYNPSTDSWHAVTQTNAPEVYWGSGVWSGSELLVFGGAGGTVDGGRYDPELDAWSTMSLAGAPETPTNLPAVWSGDEMLWWGGTSSKSGRYDPGSDQWLPLSVGAAPAFQQDQTAVWTGSEMIVWGGGDDQVFNEGGRYDPSTDSWSTVTIANAPSPRTGHTAVWTGSEMIVWGGSSESGALGDGGRYDPASDSWSPVLTNGAPSARNWHSAVWTGDAMIVSHGEGRDNYGVYRIDASADVEVGLSVTSGPIAPGETIAYQSTVINTGPSHADAVRLTNNLPEGLSYAGASPSQGSCSETGGLVTCNLGRLEPDQSASVTLDLVASVPGQVSNAVSVESTVPDSDISNNAASADTLVGAVNFLPYPAGGRIEHGGGIENFDLTVDNSPSPLDLNFSISGVAGIPWMTLGPLSGSLSPGESQVLDMTLDATDRSPGLLLGELSVDHDTPYAIDTIPVEFTVGFWDVPEGAFADRFIHLLASSKVTAGCGEAKFCPGMAIPRRQMAVWLVRAAYGHDFDVPPATGEVFEDVEPGTLGAAHAEFLYSEGITSGCSVEPRRFCPDDPVTRGQMAVFQLRSKLGAGYTPPACEGEFDDVPCSDSFAPWIEELYARGVTAGCSADPPLYCPDADITRAQMAVFSVRNFDLQPVP